MTLTDGIGALGLELPTAAIERLEQFGALLEKWNRTFNLTALRGQDKILTHHLLDSLSLVPHVHALRVLDVGSGGGLPGIPLAIARPEISVTLIESSSKKTAFQKQAAIELGLTNLEAVGGRVEDYQPSTLFPAITSRAFSDLPLFIRLTRHLLAEGGVWLAMKGLVPTSEMDALPDDIEIRHIHKLTVPGLEGERHLVVMGVRKT